MKSDKLLDLHMEAMRKRLKSGLPLTAAQQNLLLEIDPDSDPQPDLARSAAELARRLGVRRQVIGYHLGKQDAPQVFSVEKWKRYLDANGYFKTPRQPAARSTATVITSKALLCDGMLAAWEIVQQLEEHVLSALKVARVKLPAANRNKVVVQLWQVMARQLDALTAKHELPGSAFDDVPPAIAAAAKRIGATLQPNK